MMLSEKLSAKDFLSRLESGNLNPQPFLFGKVKKSDSDSELLFSFKGDKGNWLKIPSDMIEHLHLIKSFSCKGEKMALVKIHLKAPSGNDAKLYAELLTALQAKVMKWHMKKMMGGGSCSHSSHMSEGSCGHHSSDGCGCHSQK